MSLQRLLTPLLSLWLLAAFVFTPVARAQAVAGSTSVQSVPAQTLPAQPTPANGAALRLSEHSAPVPESTALLASAPVYEESPGVPGGVGMPGDRVGSDILLVSLAAFAGAFLGGFTAGTICCAVFFVYYY